MSSTALADTITIAGNTSGEDSTATMVCEFNAQTNTFTFTITNTSAITQPGSTSTITAIGFDLPPTGNASASGLNGFTGLQAPSLSSNFSFSDADLGSVPQFNTAVLDFGFVTGVSGTFASGDVNDGLLPGESASFTVSGAAFAGFTESQICNAIYVRYLNVPGEPGTDVGVPDDGTTTTTTTDETTTTTTDETTTTTDETTTTTDETTTTTTDETTTTTTTTTSAGGGPAATQADTSTATGAEGTASVFGIELVLIVAAALLLFVGRPQRLRR